MDSGLHQVAERRVDHPLPLDTVLADEGRTFDAKREVAFTGGIVAAVAPMLLAFIDEFDRRRGKRRIEAGKHFSCDRAGFLGVHWTLYSGIQWRRSNPGCTGGSKGRGQDAPSPAATRPGNSRRRCNRPISTGRELGGSCAWTMSASTMR